MADSRLDEMIDKYRNDARFHYLVEYMTGMLLENLFTASELKDAAILAKHRYFEIRRTEGGRGE